MGISRERKEIDTSRVHLEFLGRGVRVGDPFLGWLCPHKGSSFNFGGEIEPENKNL